MPRLLRFILLGFLLLLLQAGGCDDKAPKNKAKPSPSASASPSGTEPPPTSSPTPSPSATTRSTRVTRIGVSVSRDNKAIDTAGLAAIGWVVDAEGGTANWTDPALGTIKVIWEVPEATANGTIDSNYWGEVTGGNLAFGPVTMFATTFFADGEPQDTGAHSIGGVKAQADRVYASFNVAARSPGTVGTVSINLGFPVPVVVTYNYVYQ